MHLDLFVPCRCDDAACAHPDRVHARESVGPSDAVYVLQGALAQVDDGGGGTLMRRLADDDAGEVTPARAAVMLAECVHLRANVARTRGLFLVDVTTGTTVQHYAPSHWGEFAWGHGVVLGIEPQVFFVRRLGGRELFRSAAFEQRPLPGERDDPSAQRRAEFVDEATGTRYASPLAVRHGDRGPLPRRLAIELRTRRPGELDALLDPLERVLRASVEHRGPIVWRPRPDAE